MEGLTKRYFWVVNLAVLAVLAFLAARVLNNIAAREIASLQTERAVRAPVKSGPRATSASKREWASTVNNRNLFNSTPPEPEEYADAGPKGDGEGTGDLSGMPRPWDPCKESESSIGLSATMVAEPAEWSFAVLDDGENDEERLMRAGQKVADFTLAAIQRERIVLAKGGGFECVVLGEKKKKKRPSRSKSVGRSKTSNSAKIKDGIKKTGKNQYQIDREMLNEQLDDLSKLSKGARVIPHYRDGRPQGFKIVGVRPGSLYSHIGVRSGDVLKGVNGEEITSPNKALELYEQLKNSENVNVEIERRGRKVGLEYNIK